MLGNRLGRGRGLALAVVLAAASVVSARAAEGAMDFLRERAEAGHSDAAGTGQSRARLDAILAELERARPGVRLEVRAATPGEEREILAEPADIGPYASLPWDAVVDRLAADLGLTVDRSRRDGGVVVLEKPATVSATFDGVRLGEAVRILAKRGGVNVIFSARAPAGEPVRLSFTDIPWRQALDSLLAAHACSVIPDADGKILRIVPEDEAESLLETRSRPLRYIQSAGARFQAGIAPGPAAPVDRRADPGRSEAAALVAILERVKSERGSVGHEPRANVLILRDTPGRIRDMLQIVDEMDQPPPQVLVETRIVTTVETPAPAPGKRGGGMAEAPAPDPGRFAEGGSPFPCPEAVGNPAEATPPVQAFPAALPVGGTATVAQVPHILVMDNEEASICIGSLGPAAPGPAADAGGGQFAGVQLVVIPRVCRGTDRIILEVIPRQIGGGAGAGVNAVHTRMMLRSGETGRIAGLFREEIADARSLASPSPAVADHSAAPGGATVKRATTILLTATIIPPDDDNAFARKVEAVRRTLIEARN